MKQTIFDDGEKFRWMCANVKSIKFTRRPGETRDYAEVVSSRGWCRRKTIEEAIDVQMDNSYLYAATAE